MNYLRSKITAKIIVFLAVVLVVFWSIPCNTVFGETQEGLELEGSSGSEHSGTVEETVETVMEATEETTTETTTGEMEETATETTEGVVTEETEKTAIEGTTKAIIGATTVDIIDIEAIPLPDTTPPVITIIGSSPVMVELGSVYTDAGATAIDDVDGDLTGSIKVVSTVDTTVPGSYKVAYNVSDRAGNAAVEVTRIVNVLGKPTVTTDKDDYSPGDIVVVTGSGWLPGETVKLDFAVLPLQLTLTYFAVADDKGNIYNNEYMIFEHHLGQEIILTATGQTSGMSTMTIFTDSLQIDLSPIAIPIIPIIDNPQIGSVTVGAQSPVVVYPANSARYTITINRGTGKGSFYADLSVVTPLPDGCTASFGSSHIYFSSSRSSATTTLTIRTTSGTTPAGITSFTVRAEVSGTSADCAKGDGTLAVGGIGSVTAKSQSPNPVYTPGSATYTITVNRSGIGPFSADLSITTALPEGCTYSFDPSTVSFSSEDTSKTSTLTISTSGSTPEGSTSFTMKVVNSDNPNDYKTRSRTLTVTTDTTIPTVTLKVYLPDPTSDNTPTYSGSAADTRTNIADIEYCVDNGSWTDVDTFTPDKNVSFTFTTSVLTDGTHIIHVRAYDAAGNVSPTASDTLTVVTGTPPVITAQPLSATKTIGESVTFSVTASGTVPLGYQWREDGADISGATDFSYTISSVALSDAGSYDVVVSNAYGSAISDTAILTVDPITTSLSVLPASGIYGGTIDLSATLTPAVSGKTINFALNGNSVGDATTDASGVATLNNVSLSGIDAGLYLAGVDASFAGDSDYSASSGSNSLTVDAAPLTVTADDASRLYGGANPLFSGTITGIVNGDNIGAIYDSTASINSPVGTYPIFPLLSDPDGKLVNYTVTIFNGTLTITAAAVTAVADTTSGGNSDSESEDNIIVAGEETQNTTIAQLSAAPVDDFNKTFDNYATADNYGPLDAAAFAIQDDDGVRYNNIEVAGITSFETVEVPLFTRLSPIILILGIGLAVAGLIAFYLYISRMMKLKKIQL